MEDATPEEEAVRALGAAVAAGLLTAGLMVAGVSAVSADDTSRTAPTAVKPPPVGKPGGCLWMWFGNRKLCVVVRP